MAVRVRVLLKDCYADKSRMKRQRNECEVSAEVCLYADVIPGGGHPVRVRGVTIKEWRNGETRNAGGRRSGDNARATQNVQRCHL